MGGSEAVARPLKQKMIKGQKLDAFALLPAGFYFIFIVASRRPIMLLLPPFAPIVYRLGHMVFIPGSGVRLPVGAPSLHSLLRPYEK